MKDQAFEKMDEAFMNRLKAVREKRTPSKIASQFSASVERKILEKQMKKSLRPGFLNWAPVWVPAFGVLLLFASTAVLHYPAGLHPHRAGARIPLKISAHSNSEISDEVTLLQELGEWTEEDEVEFN